jgi:phage anti-repressor protein
MTKRTGSSLLCSINTAPTSVMVASGLTPEQADRIIRVRRVLPLAEDRKAPCIDARKLWERLGRPHGRFNDWAAAYIKPLIGRADLTTEISVLKAPARGTPRTDYSLSRDIAANLAMMANTDEGADVREYFLDMEELARRLAQHLGIRVTAIVDTDNKVTHMFTQRVGDSVKAGRVPKAGSRAIALDKERLLKATICEVLTGYSTRYWRDTFGVRSVRDVLDTADALVYSQCYETAWAILSGGVTLKAELLKFLTPSYGRRIKPAKYLRGSAVAFIGTSAL